MVDGGVILHGSRGRRARDAKGGGGSVPLRAFPTSGSEVAGFEERVHDPRSGGLVLFDLVPWKAGWLSR